MSHHSVIKSRNIQPGHIRRSTVLFNIPVQGIRQRSPKNSQSFLASCLSHKFSRLHQFLGLFIPDSGISSGSPSSVTDLRIDFPGGAVTGNISFKMPTADVDGNPISGQVGYEIHANDSKVADGNYSFCHRFPG